MRHTSYYLFFFGICCNCFLIFPETFVKEHSKRSKKVSIARCQERAVAPLAAEITSAHDVATCANELIRLGNEILHCGQQLITLSLKVQEDALYATADLLDEERGGGRFSELMSHELNEMCKGFEQQAEVLSRQVSLTQEKNNMLALCVQKLNEQVAAMSKDILPKLLTK